MMWTLTAVPTTGRRDAVWLSGNAAPSADESRVYVRYLTRHRRHRMVGGGFGACVALVVGSRWFGLVTMGVGGGSPLGDLLLCTLTGVVVGALSAETFRLRQPRVAAASLRARAALPRTRTARAALAVAGASLAGAVVLVVGGHGPAPLVAGVMGCATVLVGQATRRAVARRARPVLSDRAAYVDGRMRAFAAESVAWLQLAAAILTAAWVVSSVDGVGGVTGPLVLGALIATIVVLRRAKPGPRRDWRPDLAA